ncbi:MAG: ATP-binding cassette domain-containing protein [Peptostreptococcaceae bacterium]|nr:ATP-binding cassette domain-containing protein [Peptostreptococcaceae bacterium]
MQYIDILAGRDKDQRKEEFGQLTLRLGELWTIVGDTGSGKSRLIRDIEQLADGDSVTGRKVHPDGLPLPRRQRQALSSGLIAHLSQNMRFSLDTTVEDFLRLHNLSRNKTVPTAEILSLANEITPEPVRASAHLNTLSGGQSRALMIADIARICDSPIVLIDEIENAGIDKVKALHLLLHHDKLLLVVTHDVQTALMAQRRIVMKNGAVAKVLKRSPGESALYRKLSQEYEQCRLWQNSLRKGSVLA